MEGLLLLTSKISRAKWIKRNAMDGLFYCNQMVARLLITSLIKIPEVGPHLGKSTWFIAPCLRQRC